MRTKIAIFLLIPVFFASCLLFGPDRRDWNGQLDGVQGLYGFDVAQNGKNLEFTVTVNRSEYDALVAGGEFTPPPELFLWISPTHAKDGNWNAWGMRFWPVARKRVPSTFFTDAEAAPVVITVNLERIALDWNMNWLSVEHFNGDPDENNTGQQDRPDMNGVYAIVADNYLQDDYYDYHSDGYYDPNNDDSQVYEYNGEWSPTRLMTPPDGTEQQFLFRNSRPYGHGYSDVAAILDGDWTPILIAPAGMEISTEEVFGGIEFQIELNVNLAEYPGEVAVRLPIDYGNEYTLNADNATSDSDPEAGEYRWRIVYKNQDYGTPQFIDDVVHAPGPYPDPWSQYQIHAEIGAKWSPYYQSFTYHGYANVLFSTAFDDGFVNHTTPLVGSVGGDLTRTVQSPHPWDEWTTVENEDNNWNIADIETLWFSPMLGVGGNVLGLGSGGVIANPYGPYRNDVVEFPAYNYYNHLDLTDAWEIIVSFDLYKDFDYDYDWNEELYIELGRYDSTGDEWSWHLVHSWNGPQDHWENQGWRRETVWIQKWLLEYLDNDAGTYIGYDAVIRFRFQSGDAWNPGNGVFIDNLSVLVLE